MEITQFHLCACNTISNFTLPQNSYLIGVGKSDDLSKVVKQRF